jgi:hypothetical protein
MSAQPYSPEDAAPRLLASLASVRPSKAVTSSLSVIFEPTRRARACG